jgi:ankyrin repeat protein
MSIYSPRPLASIAAWIVESLVNCLTNLYRNVPQDVTDVLGRTPLHIAVLHGSTDVIPYLANSSTAALIQDQCHRCPLHWACTHPIGYNNQNNMIPSPYSDDSPSPRLCQLICHSRKVAVDICEAVRILLEVYPEATLVRDADDLTPLQIAQQHNADPSIVRMIQQVEHMIRRERESWCAPWGDSRNGETTSMTITESGSFPQGFPGEISYYSKTVQCYLPSDPSNYACFEC